MSSVRSRKNSPCGKCDGIDKYKLDDGPSHPVAPWRRARDEGETQERDSSGLSHLNLSDELLAQGEDWDLQQLLR